MGTLIDTVSDMFSKLICKQEEMTNKKTQAFYEQSKTLSQINQTFSQQQTNINNKRTSSGLSLSGDQLYFNIDNCSQDGQRNINRSSSDDRRLGETQYGRGNSPRPEEWATGDRQTENTPYGRGNSPRQQGWKSREVRHTES